MPENLTILISKLLFSQSFGLISSWMWSFTTFSKNFFELKLNDFLTRIRKSICQMLLKREIFRFFTAYSQLSEAAGLTSSVRVSKFSTSTKGGWFFQRFFCMFEKSLRVPFDRNYLKTSENRFFMSCPFAVVQKRSIMSAIFLSISVLIIFIYCLTFN